MNISYDIRRTDNKCKPLKIFPYEANVSYCRKLLQYNVTVDLDQAIKKLWLIHNCNILSTLN
jgi:hypothetical protein